MNSISIIIVLIPPTNDEINGDTSISEISNNIDTESLISVFTSVFQKFNSIDAGIKLVDGYGSGVAALKPYIGSVFIFVPQKM